MLHQSDKGQGCEQNHRPLGKIENAGSLEDQHEAQSHKRVHYASEQTTDDDFSKKYRI